MKPQLLIDDTNWPSGHQILKSVKRRPDAFGRNSKNNAPSTGRFPPTPNAMAKKITHTMGHDGAAATVIPKAPAISNVVLNAIFLPIISEKTPQNIAPKQRPRNK